MQGIHNKNNFSLRELKIQDLNHETERKIKSQLMASKEAFNSFHPGAAK